MSPDQSHSDAYDTIFEEPREPQVLASSITLDGTMNNLPSLDLANLDSLIAPGDTLGSTAFGWNDNNPMSFYDYLPMPDPSFSFTSLTFAGSPHRHDSSHSFDATQGSLRNQDSGGVVTRNEDGGREPQFGDTQGGRPMLPVSPPLLSSDIQKALLKQFESELRPPASLVGIDPFGWRRIKRYVIQKAKEGNEHVKHALFALSMITFNFGHANGSTQAGGTSESLSWQLHEAARVSMEIALRSEGWENKHSNTLLVTLFLLAWFEITCDNADNARPSFPSTLAEDIIMKGRDWNSGSTHVFQWLTLLDSKMSHMGGRHLLTEGAHRVALQPRPAVPPDEDIDDEDSEISVESWEPSSNGSTRVNGYPKTSQKRLAYLLSSQPPLSPSPAIIRADIFNIILQPAFEFHIKSQAYSRRIGCHDRHHRTRETPEDEYEVITACRGYEEELQELWKHRPGILNLSADQLKHFVSESIAKRLEQLFSVYIATFWAHFLYIHRVAFWSLKHTAIARKAVKETGNMLRRSVGQGATDVVFDADVPRQSENVIHPGLMWTCYLFGCEVADPVQQDWTVRQLRALGELQPCEAGSADEDAARLQSTRLDRKGAQNALKVSELLKALVDRQESTGARVDGKYLSQEIFGCHFYII
ncbi:C6 finger domain-containing protein [Colletotrichum camelliae]|nr:C6 finger domain-containing protein [Colletotrichum camelliae]